MCCVFVLFLLFTQTATTEIYTLSLHDALPISNQAIKAARAVAELPETPLLREFQRLAERYSERLAKQLAKLLGNPQTPTPTQTQTPTQQTDDDPGKELVPSPADAGQSVGRSVSDGDDSQDSLDLVYEHYRQRIGILGPLTVDKLRWW